MGSAPLVKFKMLVQNKQFTRDQALIYGIEIQGFRWKWFFWEVSFLAEDDAQALHFSQVTNAQAYSLEHEHNFVTFKRVNGDYRQCATCSEEQLYDVYSDYGKSWIVTSKGKLAPSTSD